MLVDEKPPLDEDLLMHFGIKGMRWGHRKPQESGSSSGRSSAAPKQGMSTKKKVAIGVGIGVGVAGAAAAAYFLARSGKSPISAMNKVVQAAENRPKISAVPKAKLPDPSPAQMMRRLEAHKMSHLDTRSYLAGKQAVLQGNGRYKLMPSMEAQNLARTFPKQSRLSAFRNRRFTPNSDPVISRRLRAPKAPKQLFPVQSRLGRTQKINSDMDATTKNLLTNNDAMIKALQDPNHVWRL